MTFSALTKKYLKNALVILFLLCSLLFLFFVFPETFNSVYDPISKKVGELLEFYVTNQFPEPYSNSIIADFAGFQNSPLVKGIFIYLLFLNLFAALLVTSKSIGETLRALFGLPEILSIKLRLFFLLIPFLKKSRKGNPWGVVYDSITKLPIDPALVTLSTREPGVGEFKQTRVTDIQGRFSFLVTPGHYSLTAEKTNYRFPSQLVQGTKDGDFENVYHGEIVEVENPYIINVNIPMDPLSYDWNQAIKPKSQFEFLREHARSTAIFAGTTTAIISYFVYPLALNLLIIPLYLFNFLFWRTYIQQELWGLVKSKITGEIFPRIGVRAIRQPYKLSVGYTISDHLGRYFLLLSEGNYTVQVETIPKEGEKPEILTKIENVTVTKNKPIINFDIGV